MSNSDLALKPQEYVISAGEGTMLKLGIADNQHTVKAYAEMAIRQSMAANTPRPTIRSAHAGPECKTGQ